MRARHRLLGAVPAATTSAVRRVLGAAPLTALVVLAGPGVAWADGRCSLPRVEYRLDERVRIDHSKRLGAGPRARTIVLGHVRPVTTIGVKALSRGRCIQRLDVVLRVDYEIAVPANFPQGSCRYKAVLAHERRHITIWRSAYGRMGPVAKRLISRAARDGAAVGSWERPTTAMVSRLLAEAFASTEAKQRRFDAAELGGFADAVHACEFERPRRR